MPYVVTNPTWFSAFNTGDFEGAAGTAMSGGTDIDIDTASPGSAHTGANKLEIDLSAALGGANVNADGYDRQKNLVKLKAGNPIVAARRYQVSVWIRIPNAGVRGATNDIAIYCGLGVYGFPATGLKIQDIRAVFNAGVYVHATGTINAPASVAATDATISFFLKWKQSAISPPLPGSGGPATGAIIYLDTLNIVESENVPGTPPVLSATKTDATSTGAADGSIDLVVTGGVGPFTYAWSSGQSTQDIGGLAAGVYSVTVTDTGTGLTSSLSVTINELAALSLTLAKTDTTSVGANDGTIISTVTGGSGNFDYLWNDANTSPSRNSLAPGDYSLQVTDLITGQIVNASVTISDPELVPVKGTYFYIHQSQGLRFVQEVTPDYKTIFQNFDNTLFCKMKHPAMWKSPWAHRVCIGDVNRIQILSDYPAHSAEICDLNDNPVASFAVPRVLQLKDVNQIFDMYATAPGTGDAVNDMRLFFASSNIPIPLALDQVITISNNLDGLNGSYTIQAIRTEVSTGVPYLVISKTWAIATPLSNFKGNFLASLAQFDVYETDFDFSSLPAGRYYARIKGINDDSTYRLATSESINLRATQPETNLLTWTNDTNRDRMVFQTGIVHKMRIYSQLYKPKPKSESDNYRQSDDDPVKLNNFVRRCFKWEIFQQPWFIHELLNLAWGYSDARVNGVRYFSEDGPAETGERIRYGLNDNNVTIEQKGWLKDDSEEGEDIAPGGFLISQEGYVISQLGKIKG